jgi:triosephosphate isomerase
MERRKIVAGNWKMNKDYREGRDLSMEIVEAIDNRDTLVILCPPYIHLQNVNNIIKEVNNLKLGAQNCHQEVSGAFTGEISVGMLKSVGAEYVILGHSERREYFKESNALLAAKVKTALEAGLQPIFCCGEPLQVREAGDHVSYVAKQLEESLFDLSTEDFQRIVIAYEPIWAIGTGKTASPEQAQEMHANIRTMISEKYGQDVAQACSILYGGSVKPANAKEIFGQADVDGGLIGGASLKAADFHAIVKSF